MKDLTGLRAGPLTVLEFSHSNENSRPKRYFWKCICDCGNISTKEKYFFLKEKVTKCSKSCRIGIHPLRGTPTEKSWQKLLNRCNNKEYEEWHGDVDVCDRWNPEKGGSFENFVEDMGERPEGMTINRINGSKLYSKETCEWATLSLQSFDQKRSKVNTSGRTGVSWNKLTGKWVATIKKNRKSKYLYSGDSFELACKAREKAELEMYGFTKE